MEPLVDGEKYTEFSKSARYYQTLDLVWELLINVAVRRG